jgi:two-component system NtrC family sensor kinase
MNPLSRLWRSTRTRLITSFLAVALLVGLVSLFAGGQLLYNSVLSEATNRVRLDLNAAREIYDQHLRSILLALEISVLEDKSRHLSVDADRDAFTAWLRVVARKAKLDFLSVADEDGRVLASIGTGPMGRAMPGNELFRLALRKNKSLAGTIVMDHDSLAAEDPALARRANIEQIATSMARPQNTVAPGSGLVLAAAAPLSGGGLGKRLLFYGGALLNRNNSIVDTVGQTVFRNEVFNGRDIGSATVFLGDMRIATTILDAKNKRAIGTRASSAVSQAVLDQGRVWSDRAFVVDDWYITAYEPITDIAGRRVGMIYVGVLEDKYSYLWRQTLLVFSLTTLLCMACAVMMGAYLSGRIIKPVNQLIDASYRVSQGDLSPDIGPLARSDLGVLQSSFLEMLKGLREREKAQREESEKRLAQSEKQAIVGRLAAGVAHEINNPLTGVLTFTHLLLRREDLAPEARADLETIASQTDRVRNIVKDLLDFSRQTKLEAKPCDFNPFVAATVRLLYNQAMIRGIELTFDPREEFPVMNLDRSQMQGVLVNMIINAMDATEPGGKVTVVTRPGNPDLHDGRQGVVIDVIDTGHGIAPENIDKLFDPFFTTKEVGKGTGLGLAVSQGVVARHGGTIKVKRTSSQGSTFTIWLPEEIRSEGYE